MGLLFVSFSPGDINFISFSVCKRGEISNNFLSTLRPRGIFVFWTNSKLLSSSDNIYRGEEFLNVVLFATYTTYIYF